MRRLIVALALWPMLAFGQPVVEKRATLDKMLDALGTAPNEQIASGLEDKIIRSWVEASSPAVTLLMSAGLRKLGAKAPDDAIEIFNDALLLDPTLAEAWHQRGTARYLSGDLPGAIRDIQETLKLEPRHFAAWRTLTRIAEGRDDWKAAYDAWRHVLAIDPRTPKGEERLKDLKRKAFGDNT